LLAETIQNAFPEKSGKQSKVRCVVHFIVVVLIGISWYEKAEKTYFEVFGAFSRTLDVHAMASSVV